MDISDCRSNEYDFFVKKVAFSDGDTIYNRGDEAEVMYIIVDGRVELSLQKR